uniref:Uncharacterized protein n=1 Tax=Oryza brachyantha TaxID=4533 RepID=J3LLL3_ORYBR
MLFRLKVYTCKRAKSNTHELLWRTADGHELLLLWSLSITVDTFLSFGPIKVGVDIIYLLIKLIYLCEC